MRRLPAVALALFASLALAFPAAASTSKPAPGGVSVDTAVQACYDNVGPTINSPQYGFCRGLQGLSDMVGALCRTPARDLPNEATIQDCRLADGRTVSEAQVAAYRKSWVHRALGLQRQLDARSPLY